MASSRHGGSRYSPYGWSSREISRSRQCGTGICIAPGIATTLLSYAATQPQENCFNCGGEQHVRTSDGKTRREEGTLPRILRHETRRELTFSCRFLTYLPTLSLKRGKVGMMPTALRRSLECSSASHRLLCLRSGQALGLSPLFCRRTAPSGEGSFGDVDLSTFLFGNGPRCHEWWTLSQSEANSQPDDNRSRRPALILAPGRDSSPESMHS